MNKQRLTSLLLIFVLLLSVTGVDASNFLDMPNNWSTDALESAVDNNIIKGSNNKIRPNDELTRGELATIVGNMLNLKEIEDISNYKDVDVDDWYYEPIAKAVKANIIKGISKSKLDPQGKVTREQSFVIMARVLQLQKADNKLSKFKDKKDISSWAVEGTNALVSENYLQGSNGKLDPKKILTRAEFVQMIYNISEDYYDGRNNLNSNFIKKSLIVREPINKLESITVQRDLIIGDNLKGKIVLENVDVKGRLLIRSKNVDIELINSNINDIVDIYNEENNGNVDNDSNENKDKNLKIHFIDVGQGDSSLIELPNGKNALIDGGPRSNSEQLMKYLRAEKIKEIEYLIATHPHEDHIGGLPEVLKNIKVNNVYMPDKTANTKIFESLLKEIQNQNLKINIVTAGDILIDDGELAFKFIGPVKNDYKNTNDFSIVTRIDYGDTSLLVMGDAEERSEKDIIESGENLKVDVLRVGHHGSNTSSSMEFIKEVNPSIGVISCGKDNQYGHPNIDVINRFESNNIDIYRTDLNGTVTIVSDGKEIDIMESYGTEDDNHSNIYKGIYVGSVKSDKYHKISCISAKRISSLNKIFFKTKLDAENSAYKPCNICKP